MHEFTKQQYRNELLELKAPQDGSGGVAAQQPGTHRPTPCGCIIKDVATHTIGTVISPGTILMTLVPQDEALKAEVWVSNEDVGFIHTGQPTKVKFVSYQFQKYGMVDGEVVHLSADATENKPKCGLFRRRLTFRLNRASGGRSHNTQQSAGSSAPPSGKPGSNQPYAYRALIDLKAQKLIAAGVRHTLTPGMQVTAEIHLGTRTILEYLLSPVMGAFQEAGRER